MKAVLIMKNREYVRILEHAGFSALYLDRIEYSNDVNEYISIVLFMDEVEKFSQCSY